MADATYSGPDGANGAVGTLTTADGKPLKAALNAAQSKARWRAFFLVAPLFLFVLFTFVAPIGQLLYRSVHNPGFTTHTDLGTKVETPIMVELRAWFDENPRGTEPDEAAYAGAAMRGASSAYTLNFYYAAIDRTVGLDGKVTQVDPKRQVYVTLFQRTLFLSLLITFLCFVLAYPIAHLLATLPLRYSNLLMIFVLLPFWTSLLVRTTSWMVLLQSQGVVNDALVATGALADENRIQMMYNQTGTIVAMVHPSWCCRFTR